MLETIHTILKNDKIRNLHLNSEALNILISAFLWVQKYKNQPKPFHKIYEILLNILCDTINMKSGKYFIPCGYVNEMEKAKKLAISHGILGLLYHIFQDDSTDYTTKRVINTKILSYVSSEDIKEQIEVLNASFQKISPKTKEISPQTSNTKDNLDPSTESLLEVKGNGYRNTSPKNSKD